MLSEEKREDFIILFDNSCAECVGFLVLPRPLRDGPYRIDLSFFLFLSLFKNGIPVLFGGDTFQLLIG